MATVDVDVSTFGTRRDYRPGPTGDGHHGQGDLAEVIDIRPRRSHRFGFLGSWVTTARVFASPRTSQATSVRPPRPPSSPALRHHPMTDDAA
jgi:hypothetical protein